MTCSHTRTYLSGHYLCVFNEGIEAERERIIELLQPLGCPANGVEHDCSDGLGYTTAQDLIKLIKKGERE